MQPRTNGYRIPKGYDRTYRCNTPQARNAPLGNMGNRQPIAGIRHNNPAGRMNTNAANPNKTGGNRNRTLGIALSLTGILSFFMGWISLGPMEISGLSLLTGGMRGGSPIYIYATAAALIGCVSLMFRLRSADNMLLGMALGAGMLAMGVMSFMNLNSIPYNIMSPGIGMLICCVSGIGLALLPLLEKMNIAVR